MIRTLRLPILALSLTALLAAAPAAQRPKPAEENVPQAPRGALALVVKARMSAALSVALRLSPEQRNKLDKVLAWQELGAPRSGHTLQSEQALLDMLTLPMVESILVILEPGQTQSFLSLIGPKRRAELLELARLRRAAFERVLKKTLKVPAKAPAKKPGKARKKAGGRRRGKRGGKGRRAGSFAPFG